ncbi:MAG: TorF family putative porin [Pseudomonadota bacterium]
MKSLRAVRYTLLAAAVAGGAIVSSPAVAGVSATAGVANLYLWRGLNLGGSTPVVMGSLDYGHDSGLFAGVWGSSGDTTLGTEVDLYAGYAYSSDSFGFKASVIDYEYPRGAASGELYEAALNFTASGFFADVVVGLGDYEDANYFDVGYTYEKFTGKVGMTDWEEVVGPETDHVHADLTYAYNERLAFTVSGIVEADDAVVEKDALFVVSYTLPLELK